MALNNWYEEQFDPGTTNQRNRAKNYVDPFLAICERCALPDCVRAEGAYQQAGWGMLKSKIAPCPIYQIDKRGWDVETALERRAELNLLDDEVTQ